MGSEPFISVENLSLRVPVYVQRERSARSMLTNFFTALFDPPLREYRDLLHDLSFEIKDGDRVAIIGANGAGKSTLLRALVGAYQPTSGTIRSRGSRQAILNVSLGFNGDATVKENILLRGATMDLPLRELRRLAPEILAFAELEDKANDRLRTLSSGQRMRLGFAITTAQQSDILMMDEWIGTGDAGFIEKARLRMMSRVDGSRILVMASHNAQMSRHICNKAIYLRDGGLVAAGAYADVQGMYHAHIGVPMPPGRAAAAAAPTAPTAPTPAPAADAAAPRSLENRG